MTRRFAVAASSTLVAIAVVVMLSTYLGNAPAVVALALALWVYALGVKLARGAFKDEEVLPGTMHMYVYAWPVVMLLCTIADLDGAEEPK